MRLRNPAAVLALACSAGAAAALPVAAPAQDAPRPVQVTPGPPGATPVQPPDAPPGPPAPADERQRAIELYRAHFGGQLTRAPFLGVNTSPVPAALRQHLGLPEGVGLVVEFVEPESPAAAAGIKQYDIIKKFDEQILVNAQQLAVLVRARKAGDEVKLTLIRGGKEQSLSARLVEKEVKPLGEIDFFDWAAPGAVPGPAAPVRRTNPRDLRGRTAGGGQPGPGGDRRGQQPESNPGTRRIMSVWRDNDMTLEITKNSNEPGRRLYVSDKAGKVLFDVNLDDEKQRSTLPPNVAEKVRQMEARLPGAGQDGAGAEVRFEFEASRSESRNEQRKQDRNKNDNDNDNDNDDDGDANDANDREAKSKRPIGPNDLLHIAIAHVHGPGVETIKTTRVRDGRVRLPYVEPIRCEGMTEAQLEKQIVSAYADAKVAPNVSVRVRKVTQDKPEP
jgi:hypothetical protein